jgi:hypothetical protein
MMHMEKTRKPGTTRLTENMMILDVAGRLAKTPRSWLESADGRATVAELIRDIRRIHGAADGRELRNYLIEIGGWPTSSRKGGAA